ncbi:hypothetical protein ACH5RR_029251 [Cinchona calisaya]|uniref:Uncharacterized protein n=1 Tax=Cinchona calisaya TaxID=153742 RepID=A0ABD2YUP1_9GENT
MGDWNSIVRSKSRRTNFERKVAYLSKDRNGGKNPLRFSLNYKNLGRKKLGSTAQSRTRSDRHKDEGNFYILLRKESELPASSTVIFSYLFPPPSMVYWFFI